MDEFDWSPLGEGFWLEAQKTCGASDLQARFACCHHRGMTATGAARAAGYSGDDASIRQAGHRAAKSNAVVNVLQLAAAEAKGGDDGTVGVAEAKRILSKLARGSDPSVRIKALESLAKLEDRHSDHAPKMDFSPEEVLKLIVSLARPEGRPIIWAELGLLKFHWHTPYVNEFVPWLKAKRPLYWAELRKIISPHGQLSDYIDGLEARPVLSIEELCSLTRSKYLNREEEKDSAQTNLDGERTASPTQFA
jgi:hypothetical protein